MGRTLDALIARGKMRRMQESLAHSPEHVDVLVVGGGINGTGIARDAAGRGL
jgi:glycerol-3-phosphate dehydrogenase